MKGLQNSGCVLGICKSGYQTPQMNVHLRWGCLMFIKRTWTFSDRSSLETMEEWPLELRLCNCFIVSDCAHQTPSQVNFNFFWSQICSYAFRKMAIFSFPSLIYLFSFYCSACILWHWKSNKPFLLVAQLVYYWFKLLRWTRLTVIKPMCT